MITSDQKKAIETKNTNVLVSAGAGSGKTFVLTQRVLSHIKSGVLVDELLVLTFTKAAASEMKSRIFNKLKQEGYQKQADVIDNADITTFDAFYLKLVQEFHYLLKIKSDVSIKDDVYFKYIMNKKLEKIYQRHYNDESFKNLIDKYTIKSIDELSQTFINLYFNYENVANGFSINDYFKKDHVEFLINQYDQIIFNSLKDIEQNVENIRALDLDESAMKVLNSIEQLLGNLVSETNYERIFESVSQVKRIVVSKSERSEQIKYYFNLIKTERKNLQLLCKESREKLISDYEDTFEYATVIDKITRELIFDMSEFKLKNSIFEFHDISKMAIKLVSEYDEVSLYLKDKYYEILVDEYQDTNDFQDMFINKISKNNCYMVGDVKQAIYGFRNANPKNFKEKEEQYLKDDSKGVVINLKKNFRSREEVLNGVNYMFTNLMTQKYGGVIFDTNHELDFGSIVYEDKKDDFKIISYDKELEKQEYFLNSNYVEAFIIGFDILKKMDEKFQIKDTNYRDCKYNDFAILTKNKTHYNVYIEVFEHLNIIIDAQSEKSINNSYVLVFFYSVIDYILNKDKLSFISILRSFVCEVSDQEISEFLLENKVSENITNVVEKLGTIKLKYITCNEAFDLICEVFDINSLILTLKDVKLDYLVLTQVKEIFQMYDQMSKTPEQLLKYLLFINESGVEKKVSQSETSFDAVKLMTIHKSKGLEFPVVYLPSLNSAINKENAEQKFIFSKEEGLIIDKHDGLLKSKIFVDKIYKNNKKTQGISEAIRLFYVALTRAKEQFILVTNNDFEKYKNQDSASKMIDLLLFHTPSIKKYTTKIFDYDDELVTTLKQKKNIKKLEIKNNSGNYFTIDVKQKQIFEKRASKKMLNILSESQIKNVALGTKIHDVLEFVDFKSVDTALYDNDVKKILSNMLKYEVFTTYVNKYSEFEFFYDQVSGIIDLVLEFDDRFLIVDYKLKDIEKPEYMLQLKTYKNYLIRITDKKVDAVLYSLLDDRFKELDD